MLDSTKTGELWIDARRFKARTYAVESGLVELYPVGVLARALNRRPHTLIMWERVGLMPPPWFQLTGAEATRIKRWYSREQILNLYQVKNRFPYSAGNQKLRNHFFTALNQVFYESEVVNVAAIKVVPRSTGSKPIRQLATSHRKPEPGTNRQDVQVPVHGARQIGHSPQQQIQEAGSGVRNTASADTSTQRQGADYRRKPR
jgi:hypothetical protein